MHKAGIEGFPYYVGINSLAEIATREDRVCVLNLLGTESRLVTSASHVFSGGNVAFGTGPGRSGESLKTTLGSVPVYNSVNEGLDAGQEFTTGVVYLPPAGVIDGVSEMVRQNSKLKKIIIITEKVPVRDSRLIRAICQSNGVDVFGGNCLGVADAWNQVRIGGALGGSRPEQSLVKGSIAIYSNSGNFTTTIAVYLIAHGWGTTTSISSGKDVYIHFAPREFFHAFHNDERSKGAVVYVEPGGYYEYGLEIRKPTVACVVGRWKSKLTKACGHAGSLAGTGDDAASKERWFMSYFGVDRIFTPEDPVCSEKGAVVTNIVHIPDALTKVMALNGVKPDFESGGDLSLKAWFGSNQGIKVPEELDRPVVEAVPPYDEQIAWVNKQVGAKFARESLKDASSVTRMDPKTQITMVHNNSVLEASHYSLEENLVFALVREYPDATERELANIALNAYVNMPGDIATHAADGARQGGSSPNTILGAALGMIGEARARSAMAASSLLCDLFQYTHLTTGTENLDLAPILSSLTQEQRESFTAQGEDPRAQEMLAAMGKMGGRSVFVDLVNEASGGQPSAGALLGAIWTTVGWASLRKTRITKETLRTLPWYSQIFSAMIGCSVSAENHRPDSFCGTPLDELLQKWSFTEVAFKVLMQRRPNPAEVSEFKLLLALIISNGPGTISAQGCKGAVSADGPEDPERVQINKAFMGFLTHSGFAHGGNGYEAIGFLLEIFDGVDLDDACESDQAVPLQEMADRYSKRYADYKSAEKEKGNLSYKKIPCINHPVFKGKKVNLDPREQFASRLLEANGRHNIFLAFYQQLVRSLHAKKVTPNVYAVNVDAVIASILLRMVWSAYRRGEMQDKEIETAAFTAFLFGRMIGCAAEIDDHLNRGRNMDTRTPASQCRFVG